MYVCNHQWKWVYGCVDVYQYVSIVWVYVLRECMGIMSMQVHHMYVVYKYYCMCECAFLVCMYIVCVDVYCVYILFMCPCVFLCYVYEFIICAHIYSVWVYIASMHIYCVGMYVVCVKMYYCVCICIVCMHVYCVHALVLIHYWGHWLLQVMIKALPVKYNLLKCRESQINSH